MIERRKNTQEQEVTYEQFPDEWRMSDEEMALLFYEAEHGRVVDYGGRYPRQREPFPEKVRLAKKYVS